MGAVPSQEEKESLFSDRIRVIRVVAILLVTLVHLQPGLQEIEGAPYPVELVRFVFINVLGYASVPILSIISGYLLVKSYGSKHWLYYVKGRFLTLYVPLITWSIVLALVVVCLHLLGFSTSIYARLESMSVYDSIFALTDRPINYPLYFLRDIFVISLFAPFIILAAQRAAWALIFVAALVFVLNVGSPVIIRPMTFLFFSIGAVLAAQHINLLRIDEYKAIILSGVAVFWILMIVYVLAVRQPEDMYDRVVYLDLVNRFAVALVFWLLSDFATRLLGSARVQRVEKRIFLVFLSHVVTITIVGGAFGVLLGGLDNYLYLVLFFLTPIFCYVVAMGLYSLLSFFPHSVQIVFLGKQAERK